MNEAFDEAWLELREPFDARARSIRLAQALSAALPPRPRLLDLGAGTGSLFRWLAPWIGRPQAWTLVDADAELVALAFDTIAERARDIGWGATFPDRRTLLVHAPFGACRVEALIADLDEAPDNLPLHRVDAVVNTALCDLVSRAWLERMADALEVPFYSALNVDGRERFLPPDPADRMVAEGFRRDQARDKGFGGPALGASAPAAIATAFRARGFTVTVAPSPWVIPPGESAMAAELARGHAAAAMAVASPARRALLSAWLARREAQARRGRLAARIGHADVLALPG